MSNLQTVQMLAKRSSGICILVEISKHGSAVLHSTVSFLHLPGTRAYRTKPHPTAPSLFATPLGLSRVPLGPARDLVFPIADVGFSSVPADIRPPNRFRAIILCPVLVLVLSLSVCAIICQ
jgi:hypothetical protein